MPRRPSIYLGTDGLYHCYVTVGMKYGRPDRKNVSGRTETIVAEKVAKLERRRDDGEKILSKSPTLGEWLDYYLENVIRVKRKPKTYAAYRPIVELHLGPRIGHHRLAGTRNVLDVDHVEACYAALGETLAPSYVLQCHRVLSRALKIAQKRGLAGRNVCTLIDGPSVRKPKPKPLKIDELARIRDAIVDDRLRTRWLIAIVLGLRQGETLGLHWSDIDLDGEDPAIQLETQAQRRPWRHGCADPHECATRRCRTRPCRPRSGVCRTHKRPESCKQLCPPDCTGHAAACKQRRGGGVFDVEVKSERSERPVPLPDLIVDALREHRRAQRIERMAASSWPHPDLVFVRPDGGRIDPSRDHEAWEELLRRANVLDAPLHAARHSAITQLIATGADIATAQELAGHSDIRTTRGYTDVAEAQKRAALKRAAESLVQLSPATVDHEERSSRRRKTS